jgi:hypothetical protein
MVLGAQLSTQMKLGTVLYEGFHLLSDEEIQKKEDLFLKHFRTDI